LKIRVTNFKRDLFPFLKNIDLSIPGAGLQFVIWIEHEPKYPFPGWDFDHITRPLRYIPTYMASGMKFTNIARAVAMSSSSHLENCLKAYCENKHLVNIKYDSLPLGTLSRHSDVVRSLGASLANKIATFSRALANKAKHDYRLGIPKSVISFSDAIGGYYAARILGSSVLDKGEILDKYLAAIEKAFKNKIVYVMPNGSDPGDDSDAWPLQLNAADLMRMHEEND
jgi:hypothetical protein